LLLTYLTIGIANDAFRDYKTEEELLEIEPPDGAMYPLQWKEGVLKMPFFQGQLGRSRRQALSAIV